MTMRKRGRERERDRDRDQKDSWTQRQRARETEREGAREGEQGGEKGEGERRETEGRARCRANKFLAFRIIRSVDTIAVPWLNNRGDAIADAMRILRMHLVH